MENRNCFGHYQVVAHKSILFRIECYCRVWQSLDPVNRTIASFLSGQTPNRLTDKTNRLTLPHTCGVIIDGIGSDFITTLLTILLPVV